MAPLKDDERIESTIIDDMNEVSLSAATSKKQENVVPDRPAKSSKSSSSKSSSKIKEEKKSSSLSSVSLDYLYEQGYTRGLVKSLEKSKSEFPVRIWLVDNTSPSMRKRDGHMISELSGRKNVQLVPCSRIEEMQQTVDYHEQMANILKSPTIIKTLNRTITRQQDEGQQQVTADDTILITSYDESDKITRKLEQLAVSQMNNNDIPTTLNQCLLEMRDNIQEILPLLLKPESKSSSSSTGATATRRIVFVIATDGKPTDENGNSTETALSEFTKTLSSFRDLPVWMVLRLCTDDEKIINFWNSFDLGPSLTISSNQQQQTAGHDMEVIDDFVSEGQQVYAVNRWLNYALPLHRIREMGFHDDVFDVLDERTLNKDEIVQFLTVLFGTSCMKKKPPHRPSITTTTTDESSTSQGVAVGGGAAAAVTTVGNTNEVWLTFCDFLNDVCTKEKMQWNPITQNVQPWLDVDYLKNMFDDTTNEPKPLVAKRKKRWLGKLVPRGFSFRGKK